ncbi:hypothetical protein QWY86_15665 [Pedobacter aquatilis]|uniref:hypothetical protein n=1 Tax=Pedobacter aquatilis TaxID=351343 RepID=UPI0025B2D544|nr:hypothetical protein [Pedobacter aquatilis]MDN3588121.1 hypothetical protein [Pedobacter aquatilis]
MLKTKIFFSAWGLLLLANFHASSQSKTLTPGIDNVMPPSPNASAINKFGNIPVGQSTGVPDISVPIYAWNGKNFGKTLNISLNYHNSGVKVDETASNIGIGWALNAGGVISRTVRGTYDELPGDGFLYKAMPAGAHEGNTPGVPNNERLFTKMNSNLVDTQNDIFNYSFNGQSGRFLLGKNDDILFLEQTKIKVEKSIDIIDGKPMLSKFIITDDYGYKYVFQDYEVSSRVNGSGWNARFTSSWYLTRIYNPTNNDTIEFEYESNNFRNEYAGAFTIAMPLFGDGFGFPAEFSGGSAMDVFGRRLKKITFPDGNVVDFFYSTIQRQDLLGDYMLQKIKMTKGNATYGYLLNQDYSLSGRATLLSVTPIGGIAEAPDKPYTFEYVTYPALPAKYSAQQDHWGYFNYNPGGLLPHEYFRAPGGQYNPWREFGGGNRDTHSDRVKAGSLLKMTYPTGGYTLYDMEANTAKDNWLEQNETVTVTNPPYTDKMMSESLNSDNYPAANIPFLFEGENSTSTTFDITINPLGGNCSSSCAIRFEIYNSSNVLQTTQQINFTDPSPDPYQITKSFSLSGLVKGQTYYIKAFTINVSGYYEYVQINRREINNGSTSTVTLSHVQPFVGGLRTKKIQDFVDNSGQPATTREYEYVNEDGVTSSGALGFKPVYTYLVYYDYKRDPTLYEEPSYHGNFNYNYAIRSTSTVNEMAYTNGSPVTYKRVVEKSTANGVSLGKTVRYFTGFQDYAPVVQDVFPPIPTQYGTWAYGLLKKEEIYNAAGQVLKKTENTYSLPNDGYGSSPTRVENFRSISIAPVKYLWPGDPFNPHITPDGEPHYYLMSSFTPVAGRSELTQSVVTEYQPGQADLVSVTNNVYDQQEYYLKETKNINSKNQERKTVSEYTKDRAISGPNAGTFALMQAKNMVKNVVGEKQYLNGTELMAQRKDYFNWSSDLFAPSVVYTQKQGYPEEARIRFMNYDTHGSVVSVQQENGVPMCYVWGYGGEHLLAKITNADYASVQAALGGAQVVENFRNERNPADATVESFTNQLRNLPNVQVESFTYNTLVGMTSQIDAKGLKSSYEYDAFGRLKHVKDQNGNIVKSNEYHYKN